MREKLVVQVLVNYISRDVRFLGKLREVFFVPIYGGANFADHDFNLARIQRRNSKLFEIVRRNRIFTSRFHRLSFDARENARTECDL